MKGETKSAAVLLDRGAGAFVETLLLSHARIGTPRSPGSPMTVSRRLRRTRPSARLASMMSRA